MKQTTNIALDLYEYDDNANLLDGFNHNMEILDAQLLATRVDLGTMRTALDNMQTVVNSCLSTVNAFDNNLKANTAAIAALENKTQALEQRVAILDTMDVETENVILTTSAESTNTVTVDANKKGTNSVTAQLPNAYNFKKGSVSGIVRCTLNNNTIVIPVALIQKGDGSLILTGEVITSFNNNPTQIKATVNSKTGVVTVWGYYQNNTSASATYALAVLPNLDYFHVNTEEF